MKTLLILALCLAVGIQFQMDFEQQNTSSSDMLGYFIRSVNPKLPEQVTKLNNEKIEEILDGVKHFRLLPGKFPEGMEYHFDGLAMIQQFKFNNGEFVMNLVPYESRAYKFYNKGCLFLGTGTLTFGYQICFKNPLVNLLPIQDQLWLTIDTAYWGQVDPDTLKTLPNNVDVDSLILNAHPACDTETGECFVEHPCERVPFSKTLCISKLVPQETGDMKVENLSHNMVDDSLFLQHTHELGVSKKNVIVKVDAFSWTTKDQYNNTEGLLAVAQQAELDLWMVMDRKTNESKLMKANIGFVNNHFINCYDENEEGTKIVVDSITASSYYLDAYFEENLIYTPNWKLMFPYPTQRCYIDLTKDSVNCENLLLGEDAKIYFDYPTFNPKWKMNKDFKYFYAIAAKSEQSQWFDMIFKVDIQQRKIIKSWSKPGYYMTEADFVENPNGSGNEDDGLLLSVVYDSINDRSFMAVLDAQTLELVQEYEMDQVIPFHAHGISCLKGGKCYPNP